MSDVMPPLTRSDEALLATAREYAPTGWRPTHMEILQLLAIIDRQDTRQPIGYAAAFTLDDGSVALAGDGPHQDVAPIVLYQAVPLPFELSPTERVVAVYELPA